MWMERQTSPKPPDARYGKKEIGGKAGLGIQQGKIDGLAIKFVS